MAELKTKQYALVFVGAVPATQVTLRWLEKQSVIDAADCEAAEVPVQTADVSLIRVNGVEFLADGKRVQVSTLDPEKVLQIFDYAESIIGCLRGIQITSVGINVSSHYDIQSVVEWNRIGDKMAPKDPWRKVLVGHVGLLSVRMQGERTDGRLGFRNIIVEPSKELKHGVFIHLNEHIDIDSSKSKDDGAEVALTVIRDYKLKIIKESLEISAEILS